MQKAPQGAFWYNGVMQIGIKKMPSWAMPAITIVLIVLGIGLMTWFKRYSIAHAPTMSPAPAQSAIPNNWALYTNEKFGYSVRYPDDWIVDTSSSNLDLTLRDTKVMGGDTYWENYPWRTEGFAEPPVGHFDLYLIVYQADASLSIQEYVQQFYYGSGYFSDIKNARDFITASGVAGRQYETENSYAPSGVKGIFTVFKKDDRFYVFKSTWQSKEIHKQILASFNIK